MLNYNFKEALDLYNDNETADKISMMLYIKDRYHISGTAYHEMASFCKQKPCHYQFKDRIEELNTKWNILPTPEEMMGVHQQIEEHLRACLKHLCTI